MKQETLKQSHKRHYSAYATLLDGLQSYLDAEKTYFKYFTSDNPSMTLEEWCDKMYIDLINKINRVPFQSEAADRGTAFNELVDALIQKPYSDRCLEHELFSEHINFCIEEVPCRQRNSQVATKEVYKVLFEANGQEVQEFVFNKELVDEFVDYYEGSLPQVYVKATLDTAYGDIDLYGYADELMQFSCHDIKTTKNYHAGNFKNHWQHIVYPFCLNEMGIHVDYFEYNITNFRETFTETYVFNAERDIPRLRDQCEKLIQFIEQNRDVITDTKIFQSLKERES